MEYLESRCIKTILCLVISVTLSAFSTVSQEVPWVELIKGETLDGWSKKGGEAVYRIENSTIIGTTRHQTPNTFLTTEEIYDDFILEFEFLVNPDMNSGVQIRSNSFKHYQNGRVHGYQVEIDASERAWSGGIYDEARRGWLVPMDNNKKGQEAFRKKGWNHYRVEAIGDTIKTWVNGVPAAHLIDDKTRSGFIGLQVHSIPEDSEEGKEVRWRNIRILTDDLRKYSKETPLAPVITKNRLTEQEVKDGWELLWDGETTAGWLGAKLDKFPDKGWIIENGELIVLSSEGAESAAGGDIVTQNSYGDFELLVDFKITPGANSGIKYYVDTELNQGPGSSIGLEYQILDDERHPDATLGSHPGSRTLASLYDLIQADPNKPGNPIGEWNTARIVSKDDQVEHWLNGVKVLEYHRKSEAFRKLVRESKYVDWPNFGELEQGLILLQDHGNKVAFRNIKIKKL